MFRYSAIGIVLLIKQSIIYDINSGFPGTLKCQRWFMKFQNEDFRLEDAERSEKPFLFENDELKAVVKVKADPSLTIGEIAEMLGVS